MESMWAALYRRHGGPEVIELAAAPVPQLRSGEVLVRTLSSGVSRIDTEFRRGKLPHGFGFPKQVGFDAVGQVVASNTAQLVNGTWVNVVLGLEPVRRRGTTVQYLAVDPSRCGQFPRGYIPTGADCALALGGLTALKAVRDTLRVTEGKRVLVVGAGGPVGLAALQLIQLFGGKADAVTGTAALKVCASLGAEQVWNHRDDLAELCQSRRYDSVIVAAGNPASWFGAVRPGGRAALTDGGAWPGSLIQALRHNVTSKPVAAGHDARDLTWLAHRTASGDLTPTVGSTYSYHHVAQAHAELGSGSTCGARIIDHTVDP